MPIDPTLGAGLIMGAGSLLGNIFSGSLGAISQAQANSTNVALQRETNAQQERLFHEAMGYNTDMWRQTNDYNSPSAQRARYEAAGFNPYLMMSQTSAGNATAATSGASPSLTAPQVQPNLAWSQAAQGIGNSLASIPAQYQAYRKNENDIAAQHLSLKEMALTLKQKVIKTILENDNLREQIRNQYKDWQKKEKELSILNKQDDKLRYDLRYYDDMLASQAKEQKFAAEERYQRSVQAREDARHAELVNKVFPQMSQKEMNVLDSQVMSNRASAAASHAQAALAKKQGEYYESASAVNWENAKTTYHMRPGLLQAQKLANQIQQGNIRLQSLNIPQAELEAARNKGILEMRNGSLVFKDLDTGASWLSDHCAALGALIKAW